MTHAWSQNKNKGSAQHAAIPNPGGRALRKEGGGGGGHTPVKRTPKYSSNLGSYMPSFAASPHVQSLGRGGRISAEVHAATHCNTLQHTAAHDVPSLALSPHVYIYTANCYIYIYSQLQIGWHRILRLLLKTFDLVPGVPRFSWDWSFITWY